MHPPVFSRAVLAPLCFAACATLAACSGSAETPVTFYRPPSPAPTVSSGVTPTPSASPTSSASSSPSPTPSSSAVASPTPTPVPGSVVLNPASLSFTNVGSAYAQSVAISETNYAGTWTTTDTCSGIATVSSVANASFSVTPSAAGSCAVTVFDTKGQMTVLPVSVTTTTVTAN